MKEEQAKKHIYLIMGYSGLLLIGLAVFRNLSVEKDHVEYGFLTFGSLFLIVYFKFADDKIGATKKEKAFYRIGLVGGLWLIAFYTN
ncbi:hypothetical protein NQ095_05995 [Rossellomorea sp. SC111]|uniref:hypothetical protein n=1 Tax=Rossellomorea sp. SC111 TaxID=2968985 RepID=UPI00215ADFBA|nr:hypothetical protein [Rossellomorea sp. SC111]MCR8847952.1 hypothetical protein [Rossellomorea sp. SC111]